MRARHGRVVAFAAAALLGASLAGTSGAAPAAAGPSHPSTPVGLTADRIGADGSRIQVPVAQVRDINPPPATLDRRLKWEPQDKQEHYVADAGRLADTSGGISPQIAYDPVTLDECDAHPFTGDTPNYWHKNHYSSCWAGYDNLVKPAGCPIFCDDSINSFRIVMIGIGDLNIVPGPSVRRTQYVIRTAAGVKSGPEPAPDSTLITINVECVSLDSSTCSSSQPQGVVKTLGELRAGTTLSFDLTITGSGADPADPDAKTYHNTRLHITHSAPDYLPPDVALPEDALRCDLASYNVHPATRARDNGACIFTNVDAYLAYSRAAGSSVKEVADHIALAQTHPENTKPGGVGKTIPGSRDSGRKLSRLVPVLSPDRAARYAANRATAVGNCIRYWGAGYSQNGTKDCDEYPFASTYDGAAYNSYNGGGTAISYSSMPLDRTQNRSAGYALRLWYVQDHIIEKDLFYVVITN